MPSRGKSLLSGMSTNTKYNHLSVEELLHHQDFILEVRNRDEDAWSELIKQNADNQRALIEAKTILEYFDVQIDQLDSIRKDKLWEKIEGHNAEDRDKKNIRIVHLFRKISAA